MSHPNSGFRGASVSAVALLLGSFSCSPGAVPPEELPKGLLRFGSPGAITRACGANSDGAGGVVVAGTTNGPLAGSGVLGAIDTFLMRILRSGRVEWLVQIGGPGVPVGLFVKACAVTVSARGDVVVAGTVNGRPSFQGQTLPATYTAFAAAFSLTDGAQRWMRLLGDGSGPTEAMGIGPASGGGVVVAGYTRATTLGGAASLGGGDVFLAWISPGGALEAVRRYGGTDEEYPTAFAAGRSGFFVVRRVVSAVAGEALSTELMRIGHDGLTAGALPMPDPQTHEIAALAVVSGGVCAAHQFRTFSADVGTGVDYGVSCHDDALAQKWAFRSGAPGVPATALGLSCDETFCDLTGAAGGSFDGEASAGASEAFIVRVRIGGGRAWTRLFGDASYETFARTHAAVRGLGGLLWIVGEASGDLLGPPKGVFDGFVAPMGPDGAVVQGSAPSALD